MTRNLVASARNCLSLSRIVPLSLLALGLSVVQPLWSSSTAHAICDGARADLNADGISDVFDVQCHALVVLWMLADNGEAGPSCLVHGVTESDLNCDAEVDVTDMLLTVRAALSLPWALAVDGDSNGCTDTCETVIYGCDAGFMGASCDVAIGECTAGSCLNGGVCVEQNGGYQCDCTGTGFTGLRCENG